MIRTVKNVVQSLNVLAVVAKFPCGIFYFSIEDIFVGRAETGKKREKKNETWGNIIKLKSKALKREA